MPEVVEQNGETEAPATAPAATAVSPLEEVQKIIRKAQGAGSITAADLAEKLSILDLTPDDTDAVYQRLMSLGVEVVEDEDLTEEEEEEEKEQPAPDADEDRMRARR